MATIIARALSPRAVLVVGTIEQALRSLDRSTRIAVVVSNYRLRDGTARKLFLAAMKRSPYVRRVLYADSPRVHSPYAKPAIALAHAVVSDFAELCRVVDGETRLPRL
jgi:hypothetical protein